MQVFDADDTFNNVLPSYQRKFITSGVNSARRFAGPVAVPNVSVSQVAGSAAPLVAPIPVAKTFAENKIKIGNKINLENFTRQDLPVCVCVCVCVCVENRGFQRVDKILYTFTHDCLPFLFISQLLYQILRPKKREKIPDPCHSERSVGIQVYYVFCVNAKLLFIYLKRSLSMTKAICADNKKPALSVFFITIYFHYILIGINTNKESVSFSVDFKIVGDKDSCISIWNFSPSI